MELWIKSQNKKVLMKVSTLEMLEDNNSIYTTYLDKVVKLGTYKTKERALEVLDEIQQILVPKFKLIKGKIEGSFDGTIFKSLDKGEIQQMSCYVYEMPEE